MGESPTVFTKDEVEGLMRTDGTPLESSATERVAKVGDVQRDPDKQAPAAPPTLRGPGEKLPQDDEKAQQGAEGTMRPVQFPKQKPDAQPGANPDGEPEAAPPASSQPATSTQPTQPSSPPTGPPSPSQPQNLLPAS